MSRIVSFVKGKSQNLFSDNLILSANRTHNLNGNSLRFNGATNAGIMINSDFTGSALIGALNSSAQSAIHGVSWNTNGYGVIGATAIGFNGRAVLGTAQNANLAIGVEAQALGPDLSIGVNSVVTNGTTRYTFYGYSGTFYTRALNGSRSEYAAQVRDHTGLQDLFYVNNYGDAGVGNTSVQDTAFKVIGNRYPNIQLINYGQGSTVSLFNEATWFAGLRASSGTDLCFMNGSSGGNLMGQMFANGNWFFNQPGYFTNGYDANVRFTVMSRDNVAGTGSAFRVRNASLVNGTFFDSFEIENGGKVKLNSSTTTGDFSVRSLTNTASAIAMYVEQNGSRGVWYNDYNGNQWQRGKLELNQDNTVAHDLIQFGFKDVPSSGLGYSIGIVGSAWAASSNGDIVMRAGRGNGAGLQKFIIRNYLDQDRFVYDSETANLKITALNNSASDKLVQFRDNIDTSDLFNFYNDGSGGFRVDSKLIYFGSGARIQTGADANTAWLLSFGLYSCKLVTLLDGGGQNINNWNQLAMTGAYDTDSNTIAYANKGADPTSGIASTYKQYGKPAGPVATNVVPHFYIYDYITPANSYTIQFFKGAPMTAPDGTLANAVTRIAELEAKLQAYGLL